MYSNNRYNPPLPETANLTVSNKRKMYIETYGCQMNVADSEVVAAILQQQSYDIIKDPSVADVILINTCSIRENAEQKIRNRLQHMKKFKKGNKLPEGSRFSQHQER